MIVQDHVFLSSQRLKDNIYSSEQVWQPKEYPWPADWEGRCLLALSCLNEILKEKNSYADTIVQELQQHVNEEGYMGAVLNKQEVDEQQLSGHGWLAFYNICCTNAHCFRSLMIGMSSFYCCFAPARFDYFYCNPLCFVDEGVTALNV